MTDLVTEINEKNDQFITTSSLPEINGSSKYVIVNSNTNVSGIISLSRPHVSIQKSDGSYIDADDIITKQDLTSVDFLWKSLFLAICQENPRKAPEYITILKLYNNNYKAAVVAIETSK